MYPNSTLYSPAPQSKSDQRVKQKSFKIQFLTHKALKFLFFAALLLSSMVGDTLSQDIRTFTNQEGVKIQATLVDVLDNGGKIRIQKADDGKIFLLATDKLSTADQEYVSQFTRQRLNTPSESGGGLVKLEMISWGDNVGLFSNSLSLNEIVLAEKERQIFAPKGGWLCITLSSPYSHAMVPYRGENIMSLEKGDQGKFWIRRNGKEKKLLAVVLDPENASNPDQVKTTFQALENIPHDEVVNLIVTSREGFAWYDAIPKTLPIAVHRRVPATRSEIEQLSRLNTVAFHAEINYNDLDLIEEMKNLNLLTLKIKDIPSDEQIIIPALPSLKHLTILDVAHRVDWPESLSGLSSLESLIGKSARTQPFGEPIESFINNPQIRTVMVSGDAKFVRPAAFATAPKLEFLAFESGALIGSMAGQELSALKNLGYFSGLDPKLEPAAIDSWLATGAGNGIKVFHSYWIPDAKSMPGLVSMSFYHSTQTNATPDFSRLNNAPRTVTKLQLEEISNDDFKSMKLPNPQALINLVLEGGVIDDETLLYQFPNLKYLSIHGNKGAMETLDFANFPVLEDANVRLCKNLISASNVTASQSLKTFTLTDSPRFDNLGKTSRNGNLNRLHLYGLPQLKDLSTFDETTSLRSIVLHEMHGIKSVDTIKANNKLKLFMISKSNQLPDERMIVRD